MVFCNVTYWLNIINLLAILLWTAVECFVISESVLYLYGVLHGPYSVKHYAKPRDSERL